ncbi:serine/threonine-protein kinase TBK1-like [Mytilus trossulus]|uniref:serine/threonine-protein kinase TBK1-like n=1 Tax=Mytilus trossulus TaxID=6551 RepID=UPI003006B834
MSYRLSQNYAWDTTLPLGQGATSKVFKGFSRMNGEDVAVKVFTHAGQMRPFDVQIREYKVMDMLNHENIVKLLAIEEEQSTHDRAIVMELSNCGSLYTLLDDSSNAFGLDEDEFLLVLSHVTAGMKHLRENGIVHRDIKPGNILLYKKEDGKSVYKLTDFGAAKQLENDEEQFMSLYGTEEYLHPDMYGRAVMRIRNPENEGFDSSVDLWSLGVTFYHAATGQLPFRPHGGRKNRRQMYEITRNKEGGVISGVQKTENGPIEWSKELPATCRQSLGLKQHLTPILAGLLESNEKKKWNFNTLFNEVEKIDEKIIIHVFCPHKWSLLRIYIKPEASYSGFQELIAEQSEISAENQILIFEGEVLLTLIESEISPVRHYPKTISEETPVYVFSKIVMEPRQFQVAIYPEFPRFGNTVHVANDYQLSKVCNAVVHYIYWCVKRFHLKEKLLRHCVLSYIHELHHECTHLLDYNKHQTQHYQTSELWYRQIKGQLEQVRTLSAMFGIDNKTKVIYGSQHGDLETSWQSLKNYLDRTVLYLCNIEKKELQNRMLENVWEDRLGCFDDKDRCAQKVEMMIETLKKIVHNFKENRQNRSLDHITEQLHMFRKNNLQEICVTTQSIIEKCHKNAERQFDKFNEWYHSAVEMRCSTNKIEKDLLQIEQLHQKPFVEKLRKTSSEVVQSLTDIKCALKNHGVLSNGVIDKNDSLSPKVCSLSSPKEFVLQINNGFEESQKLMEETQKAFSENNKLLTEQTHLMSELNYMDKGLGSGTIATSRDMLI